mmetsp:Transcript_5586/g.8429  ORF Transcript_5586/g.8429 Transcript_5586/m.8429 type:complete len:225 (-) Transcript_5586:167-841(-)
MTSTPSETLSVSPSTSHSSKRSKRKANPEQIKRIPLCDMPMEFWVRNEDCKIMKSSHLDYIDDHYHSREKFIEDTVFFNPMTGEESDTVIEPNMFPYDTPRNIEHWTLWSRTDMNHKEVCDWVTKWLIKNKPNVGHWNYDDNAGDRSICWFHVHVYLQYDDVKFTRPRRVGRRVEKEAEERYCLRRSRRAKSPAMSPDPCRRKRSKLNNSLSDSISFGSKAIER